MECIWPETWILFLALKNIHFLLVLGKSSRKNASPTILSNTISNLFIFFLRKDLTRTKKHQTQTSDFYTFRVVHAFVVFCLLIFVLLAGFCLCAFYPFKICLWKQALNCLDCLNYLYYSHHPGISCNITNATHFSMPAMPTTLAHRPLYSRWCTTHAIHAVTSP